jgi:Sulfotransferase domain
LKRIEDFDPDDIFVVGYPKSGNTWMPYLLAGLRFGIDARLTPDSLVQDLVPDVHFKRYYKRHLTPTFFKTHHLPQRQFRRVIYLVRDGRDVMVSYFHHLHALGHPMEYSKMLRTGEGLYPCQWHEHVESWLGNPYGAEMITIKYEDLHRNAVVELEKVCAFAGLEREPEMLESIAQNATFEMMRGRENKLGWENALWPKDKAFIRRGKIGSFTDEMPREALEAFLKTSLPALDLLGYG